MTKNSVNMIVGSYSQHLLVAKSSCNQYQREMLKCILIRKVGNVTWREIANTYFCNRFEAPTIAIESKDFSLQETLAYIYHKYD